MTSRNYIGNKGGQTILPVLANLIPQSKRYFSFFLGGGGLEFSKDFKHLNWVVSDKALQSQLHASSMAKAVYKSYEALVAENKFTSDDFIFCDPPYLFSTRLSQKQYYIHEFNETDHVQFLLTIIALDSKILITHPQCELYDRYLNGWEKLNFGYQTRGGWFEDCIYVNYDWRNLPLVTYNYLGGNRTTRQQIKRKRQSLVSKFNQLSYHEQQAFLAEILPNSTL